MLLYVLACILIAITILIAPAFVAKHPPTHPRAHCRCGRRADVYDHERPWKVWCAACHIKHLRKKGEIL